MASELIDTGAGLRRSTVDPATFLCFWEGMKPEDVQAGPLTEMQWHLHDQLITAGEGFQWRCEADGARWELWYRPVTEPVHISGPLAEVVANLQQGGE